MQYTYDLELPDPTLVDPGSDTAPSDTNRTSSTSTLPPVATYSLDSVVPRPNPLDNEVASFHLVPLWQCIELALGGAFKPNCALVLLDFAIRHGEVTFENDRRFIEICRRMKGTLGGLPGPI